MTNGNEGCMEKVKNPLKRSKNRLKYPKKLQNSLSRPQNIRVGRVTGNKRFIFLAFLGLVDNGCLLG